MLKSRFSLLILLIPVYTMAANIESISTAKSQSLILLAPTTKVLNHSNSNVTSRNVNLVESTSNINKSLQFPDLSNITNMDNSADDLIKLKRKLEIEKAQAELNKLNNHQSPTETLRDSNLQNAQTTVTGVAIDSKGKKIAWLQFADGGSLTVNIGSHVGKYIVTNITMTLVTLSYTFQSRHPKTHNIYLKRSYASDDSSNVAIKAIQNVGYAPSPVITPANGDNIMVPPIVRK